MPSRITRPGAGPLRIIWALTIALTVALGASGRVQARGDDAAEARRHAHRASNLAASGKCRQAVAEWNKAMAILRDPALLFNRGECYRKLGDADSALEDYRQFLSDMPKAPNRAVVERRIAELSTAKEKEKAPPPAPAVVTPPVVAPPPPPARPVAQAELIPQEAPAPPSPSSLSSSLAAAPAEPASNPALTLTAPAETASSSTADGGITTRPWFWITVAAVAVAAGVGAFIFLSRDGTNVPPSALGNYKL